MAKLAIVTGASAGIGAAFARGLAARGHDLILVARRADALEALCRECEEAQVSAWARPADLTAPAELAQVAAEAAAAEPDLLVNNAGFGTAGPFHESDGARECEEIALNVTALVRLTRAVLPGMVERGRGAVIQVSSLAGNLPGPYTATYSATKAFVTSFSQAVHEELRGTGVHVQALLPGFTRTEFQDVAGVDATQIPDVAWMSPEAVVRASLEALESGAPVCVPGLGNRLLDTARAVVPTPVLRRLLGQLQRTRAGH